MAFAKKAFKNADDIPDDLKGDKLELKDGSFVVLTEVDAGDNTEDVERVKRALKAERKLRDTAEQTARDAGATAEQATKKLEVLEASGSATDEKIANMLKKWEDDKKAAIEAAVNEVESKNAPLRSRLTRYELDNKLAEAFIGKGGLDKRSKRAVTLAKQEGWQLVDGQVVRKDTEGEIMTQTMDEYFGKELLQELPEFYTGSQARGGVGGDGKGKGGDPVGGPKDKPPTRWTNEERASFITTNGIETYMGLLNAEMTAPAPKPEK